MSDMPSPDHSPEEAPDNSPQAWLGDFRTAAIFFTRLPLAHEGVLTLADLRRAWRAVPAVGALIGLIGGVVFALAAWLNLPPAASALLAVLATAALTGALHEDGLADMADGCGGADKEKRIAIMRDSRIGAYGALALIFSVGLRAACLAAIAGWGSVLLALVAAHSLSRAAIPAAMSRMQPASEEGLGAGAGAPDRLSLAIAAGFAAVLALIVLGPTAGILAILTAAVAAFVVGSAAQRLIGGYTGDVLGAVQQAAEIAVLLAAAAALAA
jgi:adenosylcobinamide-GDP ribazoletransferase